MENKILLFCILSFVTHYSIGMEQKENSLDEVSKIVILQKQQNTATKNHPKTSLKDGPRYNSFPKLSPEPKQRIKNNLQKKYGKLKKNKSKDDFSNKI